MQPHSYDLTIAYRIYPKISKQPIIYTDDKMRLTTTCLLSFKKALGALSPKLYFLLDGCPDEYSQCIRKIFKGYAYEILTFPCIGNARTFSKQLELLTDPSVGRLVYFAEDDYLYIPESLEKAVNCLHAHPAVDFLSLYDHPDYQRMHLHASRRKYTIDQSTTWYQSASTCLTFLARTRALRTAQSTFASYAQGNYDTTLWLALTKIGMYNPLRLYTFVAAKEFISLKIWWYTWFRGWKNLLFGKKYVLIAPIPTYATHCEKTDIASGIDWMKVAQANNPEEYL